MSTEERQRQEIEALKEEIARLVVEKNRSNFLVEATRNTILNLTSLMNLVDNAQFPHKTDEEVRYLYSKRTSDVSQDYAVHGSATSANTRVSSRTRMSHFKQNWLDANNNFKVVRATLDLLKARDFVILSLFHNNIHYFDETLKINVDNLVKLRSAIIWIDEITGPGTSCMTESGQFQPIFQLFLNNVLESIPANDRIAFSVTGLPLEAEVILSGETDASTISGRSDVGVTKSAYPTVSVRNISVIGELKVPFDSLQGKEQSRTHRAKDQLIIELEGAAQLGEANADAEENVLFPMWSLLPGYLTDLFTMNFALRVRPEEDTSLGAVKQKFVIGNSVIGAQDYIIYLFFVLSIKASTTIKDLSDLDILHFIEDELKDDATVEEEEREPDADGIALNVKKRRRRSNASKKSPHASKGKKKAKGVDTKRKSKSNIPKRSRALAVPVPVVSPESVRKVSEEEDSDVAAERNEFNYRRLRRYDQQYVIRSEYEYFGEEELTKHKEKLASSKESGLKNHCVKNWIDSLEFICG